MEVDQAGGEAAGDAAAMPGGAVAGPPLFRSGQEVLAYYRASRHPKGFHLVKLPAGSPAAYPPLMGLSAGWLPGTVAEDVGQGAESVQVRFHGWFCDVYKGMVEGPGQVVPLASIRPAGEQLPRPLLSVLCVRWWNYWAKRWWSDYNVTCSSMLEELTDGPAGLWGHLEHEHEVYSVFVRSTADLERVSEHWAAATLQGQQRCAWYFLWPVAHAPCAEARDGCVSEQRFFDLALRMERAGIGTAWPHPAHLYRQLCGKLWIPQMSLQRDCRVPPTTRVHFQDFAADPAGSAAQALRCLGHLQRQIWGTEPEPPESFRGVVKLGFSWQGQDVVPFVGLEALQTGLNKLLANVGSQQIVCLVQRMVPDIVCEQRIIAVRDARADTFARQRVYMRLFPKEDKYHATGVDGFSKASASVVLPENAAAEFFDGDSTACRTVEQQVDALAERWLLWFSAECAEPPAALRLDFLVSRPPSPEPPSAWTCEVTECGSSLCGLDTAPRCTAAVNFALRHADTAGRFPKPLPPLTFREGGIF